MTDIVPVTPDTPLSEFTDTIQFSCSATGHIHSCWWSYDWKRYNPGGPYVVGSHFHMLRCNSISAFALALGIPQSEVMVTVRKNPIDGEHEWRCGTQHPCELPKPKLTQVDRMLTIQKLIGETEGKNGVIEI
jgi:hypothetical protein